MISIKDKITRSIAETVMSTLDESAFDDAAVKWSDHDNEGKIKIAIDTFKKLKARGILKGAEADISPWIKKSFKDFESFVNSKSEVAKNKDITDKTKHDVERIFENDLIAIISPNTYEAAKKYGAHTKWCISGHIKDHWKTYTSDGAKFYFILPKDEDASDKIAIAVWPGGTKEVYDAEDVEMSDEEYDQKLKEYRIPKNILKIIHSHTLDIDKWIQNLKGIRNADGTIDVKGDVNLYKWNKISELPIQFGKVTGNFFCWGIGLTSLKGSPKVVGGHFTCNGNQLTSLKNAPKVVGGNFSCENNKSKFTEADVKAVSNVKGMIKV